MNNNGPATAAVVFAFSIILSNGLTSAETLPLTPDAQTASYNGIKRDGDTETQLPLIPEAPEGEDGMPRQTLELRLHRHACRGIAQLSQIAQKCQPISSAPLNG